ncbi:MAG: glycoside hydrolase family 95 protein [Candidatus Sumerlaeota bacterium]|nr:glycoside hydrolase family 95 protein [Candidatus Sumerlaeota bacterium]
MRTPEGDLADEAWTSTANVGTAGQTTAPAESLILWYRQPATMWNAEALPVGNGRLGCMVFGGIETERLTLNEDTVWSGGPATGYRNPEAPAKLPELRRLLFEGRYAEAEDLFERLFTPFAAAHGECFGSSVVLGDLELRFDGFPEASNYRRELDLDSAIAGVQFACEGTTFTREVFSSAPDQLIVMRLTADRPGQVTFAAKLARVRIHYARRWQGYAGDDWPASGL